MKKNPLIGLDQDVYYEKLKNGLQVILIPFKNKKYYYANYTARYGSTDLKFSYDGNKVYDSPLGIAHFLEHKVFEQKNGIDPFTFFSRTGTGCNAGTSYKKTSYYIYGINDLESNLNFLIDFVNSPYFTEENVEKEKGIIIEEIKMYNDDPDWILTEELQKITFKNNPVKYDIAGYEDTVKNISKEDLFKCYEAFYNPNNMFLVISGNFEPKKIMSLIRNNKQFNKQYSNNKVNVIVENEPKEVCENLKIIKLHNIACDKLAINFKISIEEIKNVFEFNLYLSILINILFGNSSSFKEEMFNKKYSSFVSCDRLLVDNFLILEFYFELMSDCDSELLLEVIKRFKKQKVTKEEFERYKKVLIASIVVSSDSPEQLARLVINDIINWDKIIYNRIDIIRKMSFGKFNKIRKQIELNNNARVVLKKEG